VPLICNTSGTINQDPGGDPRLYRCGECGQATLQRTPSDADKKRLVAGIAGASIVGLAMENPIGALLGFVFGDRLFVDNLFAVRDVDIAEPLTALLSVYAENKLGTCSQRGAVAQSPSAMFTALLEWGCTRSEIPHGDTSPPGVPEDLIDLWIGHAPRSITDLYANGLKMTTCGVASGATGSGSVFELGYAGLASTRRLFSSRLRKPRKGRDKEWLPR